jgi:dCTP deaminase
MAPITVTSGGLLLSAVIDIRHRYLRLLHGVGELRRTQDLGARELLKDCQLRVEALLAAYENKIVKALNESGFEEFPFDPDSWSAEYQKRWWDVTRHGFRELTAFYRIFFRHLTSGTALPADIGYFLARGAGLSPTRPSHRRRFALSMSQYSVWESATVTPEALIPAIPVPYVETLTPIRWPLLLHELGHHVLPVENRDQDPAADVAQTVVSSLVGSDNTVGTRSDLQELLADAVSERYCGPAYGLALLRESQLASMWGDPEKTTASPVIDRLRQLDIWPSVEENLPKPWLDELMPSQRDLTEQRASVLSKLAPAVPLRPEVVDRVVELLRGRQPAPAVRMHAAPTDTTLEAAATGAFGQDQLDGLFGTAMETPCTDGEILTAAWRLEACQSADHYLAALRESLLIGEGLAGEELDRPKLQAAQSELARRDTAISRSLQAAAVHRWLADHDQAIHATISRAKDAISESAVSAAVEGGRDGEDEQAHRGQDDPGHTVERAIRGETSPLNDVHLLRRLTSRSEQTALVVRPLIDSSQIGGTTIDIRLGTEWETLKTSRFQALNPIDDLDDITTLLDASVEQFRLTAGQNEGLVLHPGELILALTLEYLHLPDDLWGNLESRSTWARIGLQVHASAGMVDAGFDGYLTLELQNTSRLPLVLYPGLRVGQMAFFPVPGVARPYRRKPGAAYSDQTSARTAFPRQHEHEALRAYHRAEREAESAVARLQPKTV